MSHVRDLEPEVERLALEIRSRHRENYLVAMHRKRRTLRQDRSTQKPEPHLALDQRQFAFEQHLTGTRGVAVHRDVTADGAGDGKVAGIDDQSEPRPRRHLMELDLETA